MAARRTRAEHTLAQQPAAANFAGCHGFILGSCIIVGGGCICGSSCSSSSCCCAQTYTPLFLREEAELSVAFVIGVADGDGGVT